MTDTKMDRTQREQLAQAMYKVVREYFIDKGWGRTEPMVSYCEWDIKKYTFDLRSYTLNARTDFCLKYDKLAQDFRRDMKQLLKEYGFKKMKCDYRNEKRIDSCGNDYTDKQLVAIYFDV